MVKRFPDGHPDPDLPLHDSSVGLVRNPRTGRVSPQFHCVHDNFFETVHCTQEKPPENWNDLVAFQTHLGDIDEGEYVPELSAEWNDPDAETTEDETKEPSPRRRLRSDQPKMPCDESRDTNDVRGQDDQELQDFESPPK